MSSSSTGRYLDVLGNQSNPMIRAQNALVARIVYVLILCIKRGVQWIVEQPTSSTLWSHPRWVYLQRRYAAVIEDITLEMGAHTLDCFKSTRLVGTATYIKKLGRSMTAWERDATRRNEDRKVIMFGGEGRGWGESRGEGGGGVEGEDR